MAIYDKYPGFIMSQSSIWKHDQHKPKRYDVNVFKRKQTVGRKKQHMVNKPNTMINFPYGSRGKISCRFLHNTLRPLQFIDNHPKADDMVKIRIINWNGNFVMLKIFSPLSVLEVVILTKSGAVDD